jgi:hypothetical protein
MDDEEEADMNGVSDLFEPPSKVLAFPPILLLGIFLPLPDLLVSDFMEGLPLFRRGIH